MATPTAKSASAPTTIPATKTAVIPPTGIESNAPGSGVAAGVSVAPGRGVGAGVPSGAGMGVGEGMGEDPAAPTFSSPKSLSMRTL